VVDSFDISNNKIKILGIKKKRKKIAGIRVENVSFRFYKKVKPTKARVLVHT
jgi:hypothetical protein